MERHGDLAFEPITHTYYWHDVEVPSVTTILEDVGIIDYSYIPPATREMALERGRIVHESCAMEDQEPGAYEHDAAIRPYVNAWLLFKADAGFVADLIEHRAYHPQHGYAGTLDRKGMIGPHASGIGRRFNVFIDLKTNDAPEWTALQLAAYAAFFPEPFSYRRMSVELHPDETYRVAEYPSAKWPQHTYANDINQFLACLSVYRQKRIYGRNGA